MVRAPSTETALRAARAIGAGGVGVLEITMTVPKALDVLGRLASELGSDVVLGAGTVLDAESARACIAAGATALAVGSALVDLDLLEQAGEAALTDRAHEFLAVVQRARRETTTPVG